jgi:hypothetical protein
VLSGVVLAAAVVACGASSRLSAARYRAKLTAACVAAGHATARLPERQRSEHLTIPELRHRADEIEQRFRSTVSSLNPPSALAADQQRLLALGRRREPADPPRAQAIAATERARALYLKLGVPGCVKQLDRSLARLRRS